MPPLAAFLKKAESGFEAAKAPRGIAQTSIKTKFFIIVSYLYRLVMIRRIAVMKIVGVPGRIHDSPLPRFCVGEMTVALGNFCGETESTGKVM
jgi:hypothetical protein